MMSLAIDSMQLTGQNGFARSLSGGYKMTNGSQVRKLFFKTGRSNQGSIVRGRDQRVNGNSQLMSASRMAMSNDSMRSSAVSDVFIV